MTRDRSTTDRPPKAYARPATRLAVLAAILFLPGTAFSAQSASSLLSDRDLFSEKDARAIEKDVIKRQTELVRAAGRNRDRDGVVRVLVSEQVLSSVETVRRLRTTAGLSIEAVRKKYGDPQKIMRREQVILDGSYLTVTAHYYGDLTLCVSEGGSGEIDVLRLRAGKVYPQAVEQLSPREMLSSYTPVSVGSVFSELTRAK